MNLLEHSMRVKYPTNEEFAVIGRLDNTVVKTSTMVIARPVTLEQLQKLDEDGDIKVNHNGVDIFIDDSFCYVKGEMNFDDESDINLVNSYKWSNKFSGNFIPRNYDYNTNTGDLYLSTDNKLRPALVESWDNVKCLKFAHAKIGKPKYFIVYALNCKKRYGS